MRAVYGQHRAKLNVSRLHAPIGLVGMLTGGMVSISGNVPAGTADTDIATGTRIVARIDRAPPRSLSVSAASC
jgi:hypothetical protein